MKLEQRLAHAVEVKTRSLPTPVVDLDEVRRHGRRQQRRRTALALAAVSALVAGTVAVVASQRGSDRAVDPVDVTPSPNPTSVRPLTYAAGDTIHYGPHTIDIGLDLSSLTVTDHGVAFSTTDGRIWFTDGSVPEHIGTTDPDILAAWRLTAEGGRGARAVVSDNAGSEAAWFEYPTPDRTEIVVYDTADHQIVDRVAIGVAQDCARDCAQILGVEANQLYWTKDPCSLDRPDVFECEDKVPAAQVYDLATGARSSLSSERYAAELSTRARMLGPLGQPGEVASGAEPWLNRDDGIGVAGGHYNLTFLAIDGQLQARDVAGGFGRLYDLASGTRLRLGRPPELREGDSFRLFQWLDDDSFALVRANAFTDGGDLIVVCRLATKNCETAVRPSASSHLTVPNR